MVRATVGHITVLGWDRDQLHVEIERRAPTVAGLTRMEATVITSSDGRQVTISASQHAAADSDNEAKGTNDATLESTLTVYAPRETRFAAIDLFEGGITLKDLRGPIMATVTRGGITADALDGPARLETTIGDIRVTEAGPLKSPLHMRAFNGNLRMRLLTTPRDARILALSLGGQIASTIPLTRKTAFGPQHASASFGTGEPMIALDTVNGDIKIDTSRDLTR
ncbi:MAG: hypothetical protein LBQ09_01790 [Acidobacteriaceae bacterium]|nr:hypothetical protein [Acidobacteriaceae bacterium]